MLFFPVFACTESRSTCPDLIGKAPTLLERVESHPCRPFDSFPRLSLTPDPRCRILPPTEHCSMTCPACPDPVGNPVGVTANSCFKSFNRNTYGSPLSVANKRLTDSLNPLDATLTKKRGYPSFQPRGFSLSPRFREVRTYGSVSVCEP